MARPNRASRAARERGKRTRLQNSVKARITATLRNTLCYRHFFLLTDDIFKEEMEEVSKMIAEAEEGVADMVYAFLPFEGLTQEKLGVFEAWLRTEMGEYIRECLNWCDFIRRSYVRCSACRKEDPIPVDSASDDE